MRLSRALVAVMAVVLLPACDEDGMGTHGCPLSYSSGWAGHGLRLEHTEPGVCPVFLTQPGTQLETGATVVDGGGAEFYEAFLNVKDASGDQVGVGYQTFFRDDLQRWISPVYTSYAAGRDDLAPDEARFTLTWLPYGDPGPHATMRISYTDRLVANISGPGIIPAGSTKTFTADVSTGQAPFRYEWYRDWELVGTGDSYTGVFNVEGEIYLRLDVIDARGEVDSSSKFVTVSACTDGAKVC